MATNFVQPGKVVTVAKATTSSGDPVTVGNLSGVALIDTNAEGNIEMATEGVYNLSVYAHDGSSNTKVNVGDKIYDNAGTLNVNTSGTLFGKALDTVAAGSTKEIPVMLVQA